MSIMLPANGNITDLFKPIYLPDLKELELLNRVDQKFIFHADKLPALLGDLKDEYYALEINQVRVQRYHTIYFDSEQMQFYLDHQNGLRPRQKVRLRTYLETGKIFLEIKTKNNRNKTFKTRIPARFENIQNEEASAFIRQTTQFEAIELHPTLVNEFSRLTLVSPVYKERITIDVNLHFTGPNDHEGVKFDNLCVSEIKTEKLSGKSPIFSILKHHQIYPSRFSKYCIGISSLNPQIRQNRFKETYLHMHKLHIL